MSISCSDEAEEECSEAFRRLFVRPLLPTLKSFSKSPFRTRNLGGRYEWGSIVAAEGNFSAALKKGDWKLFLCKLNTHVSVDDGPEGMRYGRMQRYENDSIYCAALNYFLSGQTGPFLDELAETFHSEGVDRRKVILEQIPEEHRSLVVALTNARLQARKAMLDIQEHPPKTPTLYYIVPCVTFNRRGHDTEIMCGMYTADRRRDEERDEYIGLGDLPNQYRITLEGRVHVVQDGAGLEPRSARNHREVVKQVWEDSGVRVERADERVDHALAEAASKPMTQVAMKALMAVLFELAPIPAAVLLFGQGLGHIRNAQVANRLAREAEDDHAARRMLLEIDESMESLSQEQRGHVVELLRQSYQK